MSMIRPSFRISRGQQRGAAAVEFALIAILFFTLLLGIIEFGRLFYIHNSVQEVTRRAAREAVVRWVSEESTVKNLALFGNTSLPAGAEITSAKINIEYLTASGGTPTPFPVSPSDNISACLSGPAGCIALVRVSISGASYKPMVAGLFPFLSVSIPASTVTMPAESMGFRI